MEKKAAFARSYTELEVYRQSRNLAKKVFELTRTFPTEEMYSLTDQIRRSSRSVGAQIAESWGKRKYENHFILKLTDADAENYETQHWIEVAHECNYLDDNWCSELLTQCKSVGKMLNSMIEKSALFCQNTLKKK